MLLHRPAFNPSPGALSCPRARSLVLQAIAIGVLTGMTHAADLEGGSEINLLRDAIEQWSNERNAWAFTQTVREYDEGKEQHVRVERYDPSREEGRRWSLLTVDNRSPTPAELKRFDRRKNAPRKQRPERPPSAFVDFERVSVQRKTPETVEFLVPLRDDINRFVPLDQIAVVVTVDRATRAIRNLAVTLKDPMKIAFGLARVSDMQFDLRFDLHNRKERPAPENTQPTGTAHATMHKLGDRAEFAWSDFVRVGPPAEENPEAEH